MERDPQQDPARQTAGLETPEQRRENAWRRYQAHRQESRVRRATALERSRNSYFGALYMHTMGRWAIDRTTAVTETDPYVTRIRRKELMNQWRQFTRRVFNRPIY